MRDHFALHRRVSARSRPLVCACALVAGALAGCGSAPQDPVTDTTSELWLRGDEAPELRRQLDAGTWLVEVRERGVDLQVSVIDADGHAAELRDPAPRTGTFHEVVSLATPAEVRVVVRSADHPSTRGAADVRLARFRRSLDEAPGKIEQGYLAMAQAGREQIEDSPESWTRAADKLNEALAQFDAAGDDQGRAAAAYELAWLQYSRRDDYAAAIRAAEAASESFRKIDHAEGVQNAAIARAAAEIDLASGLDAATQRAEQKAMYEAADRRLAAAANFFVERKQPLRAAYAGNLRGVRALNLGADAEASAHFARAHELAREAGDTAEQVKSLMNLAWTHRLQGQVRQAADEYASLLPMVDPDKQTYMYGAVLTNYGFCLIALGDFDRALELHTQALELWTRMGKKPERATQLMAMGSLYFRVGDSHRALDTLRAAIDELEKAADNRALLSSLRIAGNAASSIGQHDLALQYLRRSVSIDSNPQDVSRTRVLIASELRQMGDFAGAESELDQSLQSPNKVVQADALAERARLRLAQKRNDAALADLRSAEDAYRDLGLDFSRIDTNAALAQLLLAAKDVAGASRAADEAVGLVRRMRVNSANPEWRARFLSAKYAPFEARIAVDLATPGNGDEAVWKAFRTADEVRARSLADQLAATIHGKRVESAEAARLRDVLTALQLRLEARVQNPQAAPGITAEIRREIAETRARLDEARARDEPLIESEVRLPPALDDVRAKLPSDTLVLAYFVGDGASHAWLLGRDLLRHAELPGRARLQQGIDAALDQPPGTPAAREADRQLSAMLLGRLFADTSERRLLIIPDGPLNGVPFAALSTDSGDAILLDRFLIGYAPSLALAFTQQARKSVPGTRVAVVSDPVYAPDDQRLPSPPPNLRSVRPQSPNKLTRLPYSALEARAVRETFGQEETISLVGFEATRKRVLELAGQQLAVLHFATHAVAREDAPERSALYLSEYTSDGALDTDSRLSASDIMSSGLRANVVVLSGCATGDGGTLRGEGVLGLTYGFLANGAGAVVATLWPVEDASTARLMSEFYRAYRASGNAAEALRNAQLRARGKSASGAWSSFVVRANGFP